MTQRFGFGIDDGWRELGIRDDTSQIYSYTPDTTTDVYASNNNNFLSTSLFPDWHLAKDSPMLEGLAGLSSTLI